MCSAVPDCKIRFVFALLLLDPLLDVVTLIHQIFPSQNLMQNITIPDANASNRDVENNCS